MTKTAQSFATLMRLMENRYWYRRYSFEGIVRIVGKRSGHAFKLWEHGGDGKNILYFRIPQWLFVGIARYGHDERKALRSIIMFAATDADRDRLAKQ